MASDDLIAQREKIQREILALESSLDPENLVDLLSSDSVSDDEDSGDSKHEEQGLVLGNIEAQRQQIQREIEELERTLGVDASIVDVQSENGNGSHEEASEEDSDDEELDLPQDAETCLQMNLVYQEVLKEKLTELGRLLYENRQQQKEIEVQLSGPVSAQSTTSGQPTLKLFLGNFMKPYFKDKLTGLGPPANPETREKINYGTRTCDEMKIRRWEGWQKVLLIKSVVSDTMKRLLQPKLSRMEYLTGKMGKAGDVEKQILKTQIELIEKEIDDISAMSEDQLMGSSHADHDWEKIANIDFEGLREAEDIRRFWENFLHPSINKSTWKPDEIEKLTRIVEKYQYCNWERMAEELGTNRTAFMCFQTHQRYIYKGFRKSAWTKEEDQVFKDLVEKMRIGNFIPYTQIAYFMEGRDAPQLMYRWTSVLDPSIKKGYWSKEEDELLLKAVEKYGVRDWWKIKYEVPGRTDGQCRDRYLDCLCGTVKKGPWSREELQLLKTLVVKYGVGRWAKIASEIPNRIDSQCLQKWRAVTRSHPKYPAQRTPDLKRPIRTMNQDHTIRQPAKRRKVKEEEEETDISEEEEETIKIEFMESEDEKLPLEPEEPVSEPESEPREEYVQTDMKEWIPQQSQLLPRTPGVVRTTLVRRPTGEDQKVAQRKSTMGHIRLEKSLLAQPDSRAVRTTIVDHFGVPVDTYMGIDPPALSKMNFSNPNEIIMIKVSSSEVRNMLIWKGASAINSRKGAAAGSQGSTGQRSPADGAGEGVTVEKDYQRLGYGCKRHITRTFKSITNTSLNYSLLLAITPWLGNVLLPLPCRYQRKQCQADIVRERAANIRLTSTPVFLLFLKTLHIDAEGCKKVIEARERLPTVKPTVKPTVYRAGLIPTVAQLMADKRLRKRWTEMPKNKTASQTAAPNVMVPQTLVLSQPVVQGTLPVLQGMLLLPRPVVQGTLHLPQQVAQGISLLPQQIAQGTSPFPQQVAQGISLFPQQVAQGISLLPQQVAQGISLLPQQIAQGTSPLPQLVAQGTSPLPQPIAQGTSPLPQPIAQGTSPLPQPIAQRTSPLPQPIAQGTSPLPQPIAQGTSPLPQPIAQGTSPLPQPIVQGTSPLSPPLMSTPTKGTPKRLRKPTEKAQALMDAAKASKKGFNPPQKTCPQDLFPQVSVVPQAVTWILTPTGLVPVSGLGIQMPTSNLPTALNIGMPITIPGAAACPSPMIVNQQCSFALTFNAVQGNLPSGLPAIAPDPSITNVPNVVMFRSIPNAPNGWPSPSITNMPAGSPAPCAPSVPTTPKPIQSLPKPNPQPDPVNMDPNLMFLEEPGQVMAWMSGKGGITLPQLDHSLPYLPPFVTSINTLASLLKAKKSLVNAAVQILANRVTDGDGAEEEAQVVAVRKLVDERFASNPAYLLLKARFLSCFTLPALLATINPRKGPKSSQMFMFDSEENEDLIKAGSPCTDDHPQPQGPVLSTNEEAASASQFSGITTTPRRCLDKQ